MKVTKVIIFELSSGEPYKKTMKKEIKKKRTQDGTVKNRDHIEIKMWSLSIS